MTLIPHLPLSWPTPGQLKLEQDANYGRSCRSDADDVMARLTLPPSAPLITGLSRRALLSCAVFCSLACVCVCVYVCVPTFSSSVRPFIRSFVRPSVRPSAGRACRPPACSDSHKGQLGHSFDVMKAQKARKTNNRLGLCHLLLHIWKKAGSTDKSEQILRWRRQGRKPALYFTIGSEFSIFSRSYHGKKFT